MSPKALDSISKKIGFPVGSATLLDEVGVDIGSHIGEYLGRVFKDRWGDPEVEISFLQEMVATGALGELDGL